MKSLSHVICHMCTLQGTQRDRESSGEARTLLIDLVRKGQIACDGVWKDQGEHIHPAQH